jgi:hypothetical protein
MQMSFTNKICNISLFIPEGVKSDFENTKRASDVKAGKSVKDTKHAWSSFSGDGNTALAKYEELMATLGGDAYSEDSGQYWVACFQSGDTSCEDSSRLGRHLTDLAEPFHLFLQN